MPTGWFSNRPPLDGHPFVESAVWLPRLNASGRVRFLVDTGCTVTTLHPQDSKDLGLDFSMLQQGGIALGIGGSQAEYSENAEVSFLHNAQIVTYRITISIAPPLDHNRWLPSLLGMDIIRHWRMVCDVQNEELAFEVHDAHDMSPLGTTP